MFNYEKTPYIKGDNDVYDQHEIKKHIFNDVHTELALKEEELKKTKQILKEVTDEKDDLLMKVKYILYCIYMSYVPSHHYIYIYTMCILYIYFLKHV